MTVPTCHTCGHTKQWHEDKQPRHPFNDGQSGSTSFLTRQKGNATGNNGGGTPSAAAYPIDPVLRTALINKGVITPQDLRDAEELIQATTAIFEASVKESRRDGQ
jgi:hypothetical protein